MSKQRRGKLSKSDKKHYKFLIEENISLMGDGEAIDQILHDKGYLKKDLFWVVNPKDRTKDIIRVNLLLTDKTDSGIAFYSKHSEIKKINKENENQFFKALKNYHWVLGWLFGLYVLISSQWSEIVELLKQLQLK